MENKKGAMELSMNTIVIVVIGVIILTLGLSWIYGIFGDLEKQRTQIGESVEEQIRETFGESDDPLNLLSTTVSIEQGKFKDVGIGIRNVLSESHVYKYDINVIDYPNSITEPQIMSWVSWDKGNIELTSGEIYTDTVSLDPRNAPLGLYKFKINLECVDAGCDSKDSVPLTVRIVTK
jgi:hypothetical protein